MMLLGLYLRNSETVESTVSGNEGNKYESNEPDYDEDAVRRRTRTGSWRFSINNKSCFLIRQNIFKDRHNNTYSCIVVIPLYDNISLL
jgi:hypothetical protein